MIKGTSVGLALIAFALVFTTACKQNTSQTAAEATTADPVFLLESGEEPRALLRYQIAAGTKIRSIMDFSFASLTTTKEAAELDVIPGVRLHFAAGPSVKTANGDRWDEHVVDSEIFIPEGTPRRIAQDLQAGVKVLNDVGGWIERDDRGITVAAELNERAKRPDVPAQLLVVLINARTTLADVPLPAGPVGLGARWETRKDLNLYGFKVRQVNTYTLVGRVGNELKLQVTTQQTALAQTIAFPEVGIAITVESYRSSASGEIIDNLHALSTEATARGESKTRLTIESEDGVERVETDRVFEFEMTNQEIEKPRAPAP